jgi:hypothetical protein
LLLFIRSFLDRFQVSRPLPRGWAEILVVVDAFVSMVFFRFICARDRSYVFQIAGTGNRSSCFFLTEGWFVVNLLSMAVARSRLAVGLLVHRTGIMIGEADADGKGREYHRDWKRYECKTEIVFFL